jgi:hypothetical protein
MQQYEVLFLSIILTATATILQLLETREPYHTSILTGEGWVLELLAGHPDWIRCELGVSHEVFAALISALWERGNGNSKYVSLEEQLAIFLYASVTGLTIRHLGEWFAPNLVVVEHDVNGNAHYKRAFNTQVCFVIGFKLTFVNMGYFRHVNN